MTETPTYTPTPAPAPSPSGGLMSPITPDPVGTPDMSYQAFVQKCFRPYVNFNGRARRKEYGSFVAFYMIVIVVLYVLSIAVAGIGANADGTPGIGFTLSMIISLLSTVFALGCFIPAIGVTVRRVHDIGLPWWAAIIAILFNWVGLLVLLFVPSQDGANIYGPYPKPR